jgi:NAD(P)H-dependent FMN reductase
VVGVNDVKVLGIVGSPHKDGRTNRLVTRAIEGSEEAGADTEIIYLIDYDIPQWSEGPRRAPETLSEIVDGADAYVLGAPVYYLDINGLAKDFLDTVSMPSSNGKPALGIAMAGGTGKGLTSALKSIYYFFFCKGLRGMNPLPVSRFNYDKALREAYESGKHLVELERRPFKKTEREWDLTERISYHFNLPFMNYDIVDEILLIAEQVMEISKEKGLSIEKAKMEYEKARDLINQDRKAESVKHAVKAYETLYY